MHTFIRVLALVAVSAGPALSQTLSRAQELVRRGQLDSAYEVIQRVAEAEPRNAEAQFWLGQIAANRAEHIGGLGAYGTARKSKQGFARAVALEPDSVPYLEGLIGYLYQAPGIVGGDKDSALVLARRVRRLNEERGFWDEVRVLRSGNGRWKRQADSLVGWYAGVHGTDRTRQLQVAAWYAQAEQPERALAVYERLLGRDSSDAMARFGVGRGLVVLKRDPRAALRHLAVLRGRPLPPEGQPRWTPEAVPWRMGQAYVQLGLPDSARVLFEESLRMNGQFRQARQSLDSLSRR